MVSSTTKDELDLIVRSPLSPTRRDDFLQNYLSDRQATATTEMLFDRVHAFQEVAVRPPPAEVPWMGFDALVFKGSFVDLWNWVPKNPWSFAVAMERPLMNRLEGELRHATEDLQGDPANRDASSVVAAFDRLRLELVQRGFHPSLLALTGELGSQLTVDLQLHHVVEARDALRTTFRIRGMYQQLPILDIPESPAPGIYAIDLAQFASLTRYGTKPELSINEITRDRAQEMLDRNPELATTTAANGNADPVEQLQLKVSLSLYETYKLTVLNAHAVAGCPLIGPISEWQPRLL